MISGTASSLEIIEVEKLGKPKPEKKSKKNGGGLGIKITPADSAFSWCVRERAEWKCEACGKQYTPPTTGLQCAHVYGRANKAVRIDPLNAFSLCSYHHTYFGSNPITFRNWVKTKLQDKFEILIEKSNNVVVGKEVVQAIKDGSAAKHFREELKRMQELRSSGVTGRIEFEGLF